MLKTKVTPRGAVGIVATWLPVITRVGLLSLSWPEDSNASL